MKRRGLTLIELLVTIALSSIVVAVIISVLHGSWKAQQIQEVAQQIQNEARLTVNLVTDTARQAASVINSLSAGSQSYISGTDSVVLGLNAIDQNQNIVAGTDYIIFRRNPSNNQLIERIVVASASSARASWPSLISLSQNADSFAVTYFNASGNEITPGAGDLTLSSRLTIFCRTSKTLYSQIIAREFEQDVTLRN